MKKLIALTLILCMLLPMVPCASADSSPAPSIEDILNDYHSKAFAAQIFDETSGAAVYSRSVGGTTLEQETVDTLNTAGCEAYNVTTDNYDELEAELHTNFADMGLDPNCSYWRVLTRAQNYCHCVRRTKNASIQES